MKRQILRLLGLEAVCLLLWRSGLRADGWFASVRAKASIDESGKPLPWLTYPFIKFLEPRLERTYDVFEWGCGNSTLWFAERVASVTSVEHRQSWYQQVRARVPDNAEIRYHKLSPADEYPNAILATTREYDIVVIDGRLRAACTKACVERLKPNGVVVFDNSDRVKYERALVVLAEAGFRRIDFWGMGPIDAENSCTSLFYRPSNCLGI